MDEEERAGHGLDRSLLVLYGSETGHSQEIAEEIGDVTERLCFQTRVETMNNVSLASCPYQAHKILAHHSIVIFITSTTGQGEFPANANTFWKSLLRKKLPPDCLSNLHYTTFGLGDSSYQKFNWAARKLQKRLRQLGASEVYPSGEGDERHDNAIDSIYLPWLQGLKAHLLEHFPLPVNLAVIPDDQLLPPKYPVALADMETPESQESIFRERRWKVNHDKHAALSHITSPKALDEELDDQERRLHSLMGLGQNARAGGAQSDRLTGSKMGGNDRVQLDRDNILKDYPKNYDLDNPIATTERTSPRLLPIPESFRAIVVGHKRVTPEDHWQDVRCLTLEVSDAGGLPGLRPGDLVNIFPKNFPLEVQRLIDRMNWQQIAEKPITWKTEGITMRRPEGLHTFKDTTLFELLLHNLDINAIPNRTFLKQLRRHTQDEREKERLLELTLEENTQEFYDYTSRPRRTILEVLEDFPGVKIPFEYVVDIFPIIRGRAFSIANSSPGHRRQDAKSHVVQLLVALVEYKTIIRKPRQGLCSRYIKSLRKGDKLAVDLSHNQPPPSGQSNSGRPLIAIATGTGIAPVRSLLQERRAWRTDAVPDLLFFGCRSEKNDYYFKEEWEQNRYLQVIPAFSRDPVSQSVQAALNPYADKNKRLEEHENPLSTDQARMGPSDSPWLRSTEYDKGKMYVQHLIRRHAQDVCGLIKLSVSLNVKPIIMICGNAGRMPISVRHALADALVLGNVAKNYEDAQNYLQHVGIWMETW